MQFLPNGLAALLGDQLVLCDPLQTSQQILWVNSQEGVDTNTGRDREAPLKTLVRADILCGTGDIIVLMSGFTETLTAGIAFKNGVTVVGEGASGGIPTATLYNNQGAAGMLLPSGGVELRNIRFKENVQTNLAARIAIVTPNVRILNCYFDCGVTDGGPAVVYGPNADYAVLANTKFVSTSTLKTARPYDAVQVAAAVSHFTMSNVTFDDGTFGFTRDYAFEALIPVWYFKGLGVELLNGASMFFGTAVIEQQLYQSTGWLNVRLRTGGARVVWDDVPAPN